MESKKINQLATEMSPASSDLTIIGDPITGVSKKVTLEQISSLFASSISFYTNYASFPATGSIDTLYCAKDTNKLYIWSGSAYVETFPSQALLDTYQLRSEKGNANGYASLDGSGKVPSTQLPSYVDDIIEVANYASLPVTGETGKIYITLDNNKIYRWSGSVYVEIASNNAIWGSITGTLSNQTDLQNALNAKVPTTRTLTIDGTAYDLSADRTWNILPTGGADGQILAKASATNYDTEWIDNYTSTVKHYVKLSENMTIGTAAYIDDASGTNMIAAKASYDAESTSAQTMGLIGQTGITNDIVFLITEGLLSGVNTSTATIGDPVYLGLNGALIFGVANKPSAPNNLVYLGVVTRVSSTVGEIFVKVQNGYELQELHNVAISSVANNQGLFYESSTSLWKNKSIATVLGYTPISLTSLSATTPLSYNNTTGAFSISQASGSADGYLSSTDWTTFNNKQDALTNPITGTGVSGRIAYFNGTTTQTSSANLTWDATNNRVGIGLTNPQRSLEIYSATADSHLRLSGAAPSVSMGEAITGAVYQAKFGLVTSNGQFVTGGLAGDFVIISQTGATIWATSGGEKMRLTSGGNLGIGTTSPTFTLQVSGTTRISGQLSLGSTITNGTFTYTLPGATGTLALTSDLSSYLPLSGGTLTGALSGTSASFSSSLQSKSINIINGTSASFSFAIDQQSTLAFGSTNGKRVAVIRDATADDNGLQFGYDTTDKTGIIAGAATTAGCGIDFYTYNGSTWGNRMRVTKDGNVGIGTTSPNTRLHVQQSATYNTINDQLILQGGISGGNPANPAYYGGIKIATSDYEWGAIRCIQTNPSASWTNRMAFFTMNGAGGGLLERMAIDNSGNVGIGTTSPSGAAGLALAINGGASQTRIALKNSFTGDAAADGFQILLDAGSADVALEIRETGSMRFATSDTERMRITSGGNVGIGTTSPQYKTQITNTSANNITDCLALHNGTNPAGGGTGVRLLFKLSNFESSAENRKYASIDGLATSDYNEDIALVFRTKSNNADPSERMRITGGGNLLVATTSNDFGSRQVNYSATSYTFHSVRTGTGSEGHLVFSNGNGAVGSIFTSGSSTSYNTSSDYRLKQDLKQFNGLNLVSAIKTYDYEWKSDNTRMYGVLAHELKEVLPYAVVGEKDGEQMQGVDYSKIVPILIKAIQEQQAQIEELKAKIK